MSVPLLIDALMFIAWISVGIAGVRHVIRIQRLASSGAEPKQIQLQNVGRIFGWVGFLVAIAGPRLLNVRYKYDETSFLIASGIYALGFTIMFTGFKLSIAAYKTAEDTPEWIRVLVGRWNDFWNDGVGPK